MARDSSRSISRFSSVLASSRPEPAGSGGAGFPLPVERGADPPPGSDGDTEPAGFPRLWPATPSSTATEPDLADLPLGSEPLSAVLPAPPSRVGRLVHRLVPVSWRGARLDPGRPGAVVLAVVAALAAVAAAFGVWLDRPQAAPVAALPAVAVDESAAAAPTPPAGPAGPLVVSVSGKVARPGLVEVPEGARVADVLEAAGGALPGTDLAGLNLARKVDDGEQVAVGVPAPAAAPTAGGDASAAPTGPVDLNAATVQQLDGLPGVGPVMAQRILDWRTRNGRFARVEQLRDVEGIGERRFAQLRELVRV
jgi:competence protein ComEA